MFGILGVIVGLVLIGYLILKKYYAPWALLLVGLLLLLCMAIISPTELLSGKTATGNSFTDIFKIVVNVASSTNAGLGLQIMLISGFAEYLDSIGATRSLVKIASKPLGYIHSPYLLLGVAYLVGQTINIFIPSAVGLGVLMMLTVFPLLMAVGVSSISAAAVIVTMSCLDLGPASANSIVTAKISEIGVMEYFVEGQLPVGILVIVAVTLTHIFYQKWADKRELGKGILKPEDFKMKSELMSANSKKTLPTAPNYYALLPILPIVLLFIFSKFGYTKIKLQIEAAIVLCMVFSFLVDWASTLKFRASVDRTKNFFVGMGKVFTSTVALIICAGVFAEGLKYTGGIDTILSWAAQLKDAGGILMLVIMCAILMIASIITGSANAAFFAFNSLIPNAARAVNWEIVVMACPVQLVSGIARSMSPIAGVTIAVSSIAELSPFAVVKRTIPPMIVATIVTIVSSLIFL